MKKLASLMCIAIISYLIAEENPTIPKPSQENKKQDQPLTLPNEYERGLQNQEGLGWFISAGLGGIYTTEVTFLANLSAGLVLPTHALNFAGSRSSLSLDLGIMPSHQKATYGSSTASISQYLIDFTLNYNSNIPLYQSDAFKLLLIVGGGMGGRFLNGTYTTTHQGILQSASISAKAFIIDLNLGLRNVFGKNHAIDLMIKPNLAEFANIEGISTSAYFDGFKFYVAYTFLKF